MFIVRWSDLRERGGARLPVAAQASLARWPSGIAKSALLGDAATVLVGGFMASAVSGGDPISDRIMSAAIALFAAHSYPVVTVPEIAARARVGLNSLYARYPSKESLGNAVFRLCKLAWYEATLKHWPFGAPPQAQFNDYWSRLSAFAEENLAIALYNERNPVGHAYDAQSKALREEMHLRSAEAIMGWRQAGVTDMPLEIIASLIHGTFHRIIELPIPASERATLLSAAAPAVWRGIESGAKRSAPGARALSPGKPAPVAAATLKRRKG